MIKYLDGVIETVYYKDMEGVCLYINDSTVDYPLHWHSAVEIIMPYENCYTVTINGQSTVLKEGDICIIPPGVLHILTSPNTPGRRLILLLDADILYRMKNMDFLIPRLMPFTVISAYSEDTSKDTSEHGTENKVKNEAGSEAAVAAPKNERDAKVDLQKKLSAMLNEAVREYQYLDPFASAVVCSIVIRFLATVGRYQMDHEMSERIVVAENREMRKNEYMEKIMQVCEYLTEHCTEEVDIDEISAMVGFSSYHFQRLFKQVMNISCHKYLMQRRLDYAEQLLLKPSVSVTDAAMQSGFNSIATFNRIFKTEKGCTPSEFKKLNKSMKYDS
ncbi:MAG: helix-turn-helix domain-containing protein [bacterium]|nr:helix-turn-helix domain-containing protein [bacterium]